MKRALSIAKFPLIVASASTLAYNFAINDQQRQDLYGMFRSITNSSRASIILARSVYDYYYELKDIPYNSEEYHKKRSEIHSRVANRILTLSQANRGIYLKLGQYLGNLEKVVPWEFTQVLKVLQDSAPPISFQEIKITFESDMKQNLSEVFSDFDKNAIAAASLAQVHRAILKRTGQQVAVKLQFPFLLTQSKYDLIVLKKIVKFCNYLMESRNYKEIDLIKLYETWTGTLVEELDFRTEVKNALKTKSLFSGFPYLYIPEYHEDQSSARVITMQFMRGVKINQKQAVENLGVDPVVVAKNLVQIFTTMIFKFGFIHCDAHPGNILVRKHNNEKGHQIVLLDHGLYRTVDTAFIENFSGLFLGLAESNSKKVEEFAVRLNIEKHLQYLPIIFLLRTVNSTKRLGDQMTAQEKKYFREKDLANFESINNILQDLPPDLMFIIRASNLIAIHNLALGNSTRNRLMTYLKCSVLVFSRGSTLRYCFYWVGFALRLWIFENMHWLFRILFGTLKTKIPMAVKAQGAGTGPSNEC